MLTETETRKTLTIINTLKKDISRNRGIINRQAATIRRQGELIRKDLERRQNQQDIWEVQQRRIQQLEKELQDERTFLIPQVA